MSSLQSTLDFRFNHQFGLAQEVVTSSVSFGLSNFDMDSFCVIVKVRLLRCINTSR